MSCEISGSQLQKVTQGPRLTVLCWDIRPQSMVSRVTATGNENERGELTETLRRSGLEMTSATSHSHLASTCHIALHKYRVLKVFFYIKEREEKLMW